MCGVHNAGKINRRVFLSELEALRSVVAETADVATPAGNERPMPRSWQHQGSAYRVSRRSGRGSSDILAIGN
jgi:hypothetical protein